ncbi:MAG: type 4a pilus biogenesis protein PilO [Patescibacteria group bacterium]|nr:type 4a pilus biogenesis protein PilO [Patescibacteria group bacterium]
MISNKNILKNLQEAKYFKVISSTLKQEKARAFTTIAFTLIAVSVFGLFAISPTLSTISNLKRQLADNQLVDQKLTEKINNLASLQQKYSLMTDDIPVILSAIPQNPMIPILTGQIQAIADNSNVSIKRLQVSSVEISNSKKEAINYYSFNFSLDIRGTYDNIKNFLSVLTDFDRIITIDTLSLSKDSLNENDLQLNLKAKAYFKT